VIAWVSRIVYEEALEEEPSQPANPTRAPATTTSVRHSSVCYPKSREKALPRGTDRCGWALAFVRFWKKQRSLVELQE
jgi:hypothetical protein